MLNYCYRKIFGAQCTTRKGPLPFAPRRPASPPLELRIKQLRIGPAKIRQAKPRFSNKACTGKCLARLCLASCGSQENMKTQRPLSFTLRALEMAATSFARAPGFHLDRRSFMALRTGLYRSIHGTGRKLKKETKCHWQLHVPRICTSKAPRSPQKDIQNKRSAAWRPKEPPSPLFAKASHRAARFDYI